jgi:hypothetical protein
VQKGMKIQRQIAVVLTLLLFDVLSAQANVGVPMLALAFPGMIISLIPIMIIETWYIQRCLGIPFGRALKAMSIANLESTLFGIPLTWVFWVIAEAILGFIGYYVSWTFALSCHV